MIKNYLKTTFRSLLRNKTSSFVNIFGLGIGMAAFLFIVYYVRFERSYEAYNPNADNIYRITIDFYKGSEYVTTDCETFAPVGPMLKEKMPEVTDFSRMFHNDGQQEIKTGSERFLEEGIYFADPSAFKMFSITVLKGDDSKALNEPFQAVLTASLARKYFGDVDPLGQSIEISRKLYNVSAVVADVNPNTHLKFTILLSHASLHQYPWYEEDNWGNNNEYTYISVTPGTSIQKFNQKLFAMSMEMKEKINYARFNAEPIKDIHLYSNKPFEPEVNGSAKIVYFLLLIAFFIIVIAWVNYINLSTARVMDRAREVGIRKVMGSVKAQLVFQFLSESVIVNLTAGILAFLIFYIALPLFRDLTGQPFSLQFVNDGNFWYLFFGLIGVGSVLSGIYPAFVLSSFQPASILKGKLPSSAYGQKLRKGLVVFQFSATVILIICLITVQSQIRYLRNYDLGMNIDQTLVLRGPRLNAIDSVYKNSFQNLKTELLRNPDVKSISRADALPGLSLHELSTTKFRRYGEEKGKGDYEYYFFSVDADFVPTLEMKIIAGRNFEDGKANRDQVIINEESLGRLGFANAEAAIGGKITFGPNNVEYSTIIGVLKNFYQRSPKEKQLPMLFYYREKSDYFAVRLNTMHIDESIQRIRATWNEFYPDAMFHYFFLDEVYNNQYQSDSKFGKVIAIFSGLAIFIASLGLFGLSSYTIVQRSKEIAIRKVLGASVRQIVQLLSADFLKVVLIASVLAVPFAYLVVDEWLSAYSVRINLNLMMFVIPVTSILLIALVTVSFQTIKTAIANPTRSLKQE